MSMDDIFLGSLRKWMKLDVKVVVDKSFIAGDCENCQFYSYNKMESKQCLFNYDEDTCPLKEMTKKMKYMIVRSAPKPIFGMAESKSDIAAKLEGTTLQIVKHIIKIYLYPNHSAINHWKKEVYGFLHNIPRIKRKNTYPTREFIIQNTYGVNKATIPSWVKNVLIDYGESDKDISIINEIVYDYYDMLATELSNNGDIPKQTVYNALEAIRFIGN